MALLIVERPQGQDAVALQISFRSPMLWLSSGTAGSGRRGVKRSSCYGHSKGEVLPSYAQSKGVLDRTMGANKSEVIQGLLDPRILKTLHGLGPLHGFAVARRIEQISRDVLQLHEGAVYTSRLCLQHQKWITAEWGISDRKAKFYSVAKRGQKRLELGAENWARIFGVIGRVLQLEPESKS